jgi:hypothetical protein
VKIEGQGLKAGTYALFVDVEKEGPWTWIFSTNPGWGSYQYEPKYDALRVKAAPQEAPYTEFMTFSFDERRRDSAVAALQWEKKRLSFKIEVPNVNQLYVDAMRRELMAWPGFNPENWDIAAQFCADNKINLDEALVWADKAINSPFHGAVPGRRDFLTLSTKVAVLRAMQRNAEADTLMEEAIHLPGTDAFQIHSYGASLLAAGKNGSVANSIATMGRSVVCFLLSRQAARPNVTLMNRTCSVILPFANHRTCPLRIMFIAS